MMLFFYGSYSTVIDSYQLEKVSCSDCNASGPLVVDKVIKVIHFMYIPIIPVQVEHVVSCKSCSYTFALDDVDKDSILHWRQFKSKKRVPIWYYSGPILVLLAILFSTYNQYKNENRMLERLQNGNQQQIIEYETEDGHFSTMKTIKMGADSMFFLQNKYEVDDYKFIDKITMNRSYSEDTSKMNMEVIQKMIDDGEVKAVYSQ